MNMRPIQTFTVAPKVPEALKPMEEMAYNIWWAWNHESVDLWRRLDNVEWEATYHNPAKMLGTVRQERLREVVEDDGFMAHMARVYKGFKDYLSDVTWYERTYGKVESPRIAYFSAEFGLTEAIPIYSGGLGVLAGDHLKSASDLGIPLIGVGLLYRNGYFRQYLNADGWQQEKYPSNDFFNMPIKVIKDKKGDPLTIDLHFPGRVVKVNVWSLEVGRVKLLLLDTDNPANSASDQQITAGLYGGDLETRIQQEIVLGIGGLRALQTLDYHPIVYHMNEGHSAFLALERIRVAMQRHNLSFYEALEETRTSNVFTTHTPVPAGIDVFYRDLIEKYFTEYNKSVGISIDELLKLGWDNDTPKGAGFSMAVLAFNLSSYANGVSKLHGRVSRNMWRNLWPGLPEHEIPITSITNGVHIPSWISRDLATLFDRYLGPRWMKECANGQVWKHLGEIPAEELWRTHERRRERLVAFARARLKQQLQKKGAPRSEIDLANEVLNPEALTIGFARRFATYKRATLILRNKERLIKLLTDKDRPVQLIIAGKAHPRDDPGKEFIRELVHFSKDERVRRNIVFIEDYDLVVGRYLVQGADIWLNNPRRPQEASGTSGMKAAINGALNISVLDGWWDEGYDPNVGWAIGEGEEYVDTAYQDQVEANALMDHLEKEIVPLFYNRASDDLPREWIDMMKASISKLGAYFNTNRMVRDYTEQFYVPAGTHYNELKKDNHLRARNIASWRKKMHEEWPNLRIERIEAQGLGQIVVGDEIEVSVKLELGKLTADDVIVQAYVGRVESGEEITDGSPIILAPVKNEKGLFKGKIACRFSGKLGYSIRVMPQHSDLNPIHSRLILWS